MFNFTKKEDRWFYSFTLANVAAGGASLLIPLYAADLGANVGQVGLIISMGSLVAVPASVLWGTLADKWGSRKYFVLLGFLGAALSLLFLTFSHNLVQVILLNASFSFWWMAAASVATLLVIEREVKTKWERKIGSFNGYIGLGWVLGLLFGFLWTKLSVRFLSPNTVLRSLFVVFFIAIFAGFILAIQWIPERIRLKKKKSRRNGVLNRSMLFERIRYLPSQVYSIARPGKLSSFYERVSKDLALFLLATGFFFTGFFTFFVPLPIFLKDIVKLDSSTIYSFFILNSTASALFHYRAGHLVKRWGSSKSISISLISRAMLFPLMLICLLFGSKSALFFVILALLFILIGLSWALVNVTNLTIVSNLASKNLKGQAFGVYNGIVGVGGIIGSLLGGYLAGLLGYLAAFVMASLFVLVGWQISLKVLSPLKKRI